MPLFLELGYKSHRSHFSFQFFNVTFPVTNKIRHSGFSHGLHSSFGDGLVYRRLCTSVSVGSQPLEHITSHYLGSPTLGIWELWTLGILTLQDFNTQNDVSGNASFSIIAPSLQEKEPLILSVNGICRMGMGKDELKKCVGHLRGGRRGEVVKALSGRAPGHLGNTLKGETSG